MSLRSLAAPLALASALALPAAADGPSGYLRFPALSADRVVFTCEGDLWWAPRSGGLAHRLTRAPGNETQAAVSPDGSLVAYTGTQHGNAEVYVIGRDGGEPLRLTFDPSADQCVGWTPDGRVLLRSRRDEANYDWGVYAVRPQGGRPERVRVGRAALLAMAPDGDTVAFNRNAQEFRTWKRYLGGTAEDVWIGSLRSGQFRKLTQYPGNDMYPAFWGERVVFASDRDGTLELWSVRQDGSDLKQHTRHGDFDARMPSVLGGTAAYSQGGDIWTVDLATSTAQRLPITVPTDLPHAAPKVANPKDHLASYALSPDAHRLAVGARGELASVPLKEGRTIGLTRDNSAAHEREPAWSPDGKTVAFVSDMGGEDAIWTAPADGSSAPKRLTAPGTARLFGPEWSPDGKSLAFGTSEQDLRVADAKTGSVRVAHRGDAWEITHYRWSPDSRWLAFALPTPGDVSVIAIWDSKDGSVREVTSRWVSSWSPAWDPEGKHLWFLSDRAFDPYIGNVDFSTILDRMTRPHALVLKAGELDPFFPRDEKKKDEEGTKDGEGASGDAKPKPEASGKGGKAAPKKEEPPKPVVIDFDGLVDRVVAFPVPPSNYGALTAVKGKVLWMEWPSRGLLTSELTEGEPPSGSLHVFDLEKKKDATLVPSLTSYDVAGDGGRLAWAERGTLKWREGLEPGGGDDDDAVKDVDLSSWRLAVDRRAEWRQIFDESWRLQREFYWDAGLGNVGWDAQRAKYAALLPRLTTRDDLNDLLGQLIGELASGHTYVWNPGDVERAGGESVGLLGARLAPDPACDCHRFERVLPGENWEERGTSPLTLPHAGVKDGDYLFAVNGVRLGAADDPGRALLGKAGQLVSLSVGRKPDAKLARAIEVKALGDDSRLRYLDWVRRNRERVSQLSGGRIGYVHVPDMGGLGLSEFSRTFYQQLDKEALIVDDRYNGGGFVSQLILERLRRVLVAWDRPRRGHRYTYPYRVFTGPLALVVNENAGSDGDIFPESFKLLRLGPVIGTRTWGGVVGIRADKPSVDGGMTTQPEFAWWEPKRGWGLENEGVHPDIEIDNDPSSVVAGRDAQLETTVETLLAELARRPPVAPPFGPAPDKSQQAFEKSQQEWLARP